MKDTDILLLFDNRNEKAIEELTRQYGARLRHTAKAILGNDQDAEECVNDAYLRLWNAIPPARPERLQTYLGKITRNLALNRWESASARKRGAGQTSLVLEELASCIPGGAPSDRPAEDLLTRDVLDRSLQSLAPQTRKIFVRRSWYMSSVKEIAREYGLSESKVAVTLFRARNKLKTVLEKEGIQI